MSRLTDFAPTDDELSKFKANDYYLVMAHMSGETHIELSFNFDLPIGTVKSRLSRATAKLLENRKNATECLNP